MVAPPRNSWLTPAVGFGGVGGPSPVLALGFLVQDPRPSWLGLRLVLLRWSVPGHSCWRAL